MSQISAARKAERITSIELKTWVGTLTVSESTYTRNEYDITVSAPDPRISLLDSLLRFAQPQEDECPPREVTLQAVIDELQKQRDRLHYNDKPRDLFFGVSFDADDADTIIAILNGKPIDSKVDAHVTKALTKTDW